MGSCFVYSSFLPFVELKSSRIACWLMSCQVRMAIPDGVSVKVEENTRLTVSSRDKVAVGDFSAAIRKWRPPEPYKGKGIKYADEVIRRKEGKVGKKK